MLDDIIDALASEVVLADISDRASLTSTQNALHRLLEGVIEEGMAETAIDVAAAISRLDGVIHGHSSDPLADMAELGAIVDRLQELVQNRTSRDDADGCAIVTGNNVEESQGSDGDSGADDDDDGILADFLSAQDTSLDALEQLATAAARSPDDEGLLRDLRGRLHTLKGEAGVLDLTDVSGLCHALEDALETNPLPALEEVILAAVDWLRSRFECEARHEPAPTEFDVAAAVSAALRGESSGDAEAPSGPVPVDAACPPAEAAVPAEAVPASTPAATTPEVVSVETPVAESVSSAPTDVAPDHARVVEVEASASPSEGPVSGGQASDAAVNESYAVVAPAGAANGEVPSESGGVTPCPDATPSVASEEALLDGAGSADRETPEPAGVALAADAAAPATEDVVEEKVPTLSEAEFAVESHELSTDPLMGDFTSEAKEHLEEVDTQLLTLENNPTDVEAVNSVFRAFHTIKGLAGFLELPVIQRVAHDAETMLDGVRNGKLRLEGLAMNVTFEANDALKRMVAAVDEGMAGDGIFHPDPNVPRILMLLRSLITGRPLPASELVATRESVDADEPSAEEELAVSVAESVQPAGEVSAPVVANVEATPAAPPAPPRHQPKAGDGASPTAVRETIKVDAARLDALVDMIGELVIAEAMVSESDELVAATGTKINALLTRMDKITRELQEMAMSMRMVPVGSTFRRMARLARDVASKLDKKIDFVTKGDETELDKTVVDAIGDPLVHLVRNAVDHGLESSAADRIALGKPARGQITLCAFHRGGSIHIEIEDDGRGMDRERILAKAYEKGIVQEDEQLSDAEVYNLIFSPGFSTAQTVTDVSGRGVGLDVVKRNIESLRGRVEIRSTPGKGSTFSIRLPLTLAIIDGMVVRIGRERYVLPTGSIVRMTRPEQQNLKSVVQRNQLLKIGDDLVPMFRLSELFNVPDAEHELDRTSAVIVEHDNRRHAFLVDQLLGQQQIVIKPLGPSLAGVRGLAGGAIMPDGQVGLILDIAGLVAIAGAGPESRASEPRRSNLVKV